MYILALGWNKDHGWLNNDSSVSRSRMLDKAFRCNRTLREKKSAIVLIPATRPLAIQILVLLYFSTASSLEAYESDFQSYVSNTSTSIIIS
jgi:hypothetical protein